MEDWGQSLGRPREGGGRTGASGEGVEERTREGEGDVEEPESVEEPVAAESELVELGADEAVGEVEADEDDDELLWESAVPDCAFLTFWS